MRLARFSFLSRIRYRPFLLFGGVASCLSLFVSNCDAKSIDVTLANSSGTNNSLQQSVHNLASVYHRDAVNAKVDRVWKLIPGLEGWNLNEEQSIAQTMKAKDKYFHLVWQSTAPSVSIQSLGAYPIYRGPSSERSVALMFNVSWGEEYVPSILRTLQKHHLRATFFLDGAWVKQHPRLAKQIVNDGMDIGSHGTGHKDFSNLSQSQIVQQLVGTNQTIHHATGVNVDLIAPPGGSFNQRFVHLATQHKMSTILWTADTVDWRRPPAHAIVARIAAKVLPGALILMHPTAPTAEALPQLIGMLTQKGYVFKTVDDVVHQKSAIVPPPCLSKSP